MSASGPSGPLVFNLGFKPVLHFEYNRINGLVGV